MPGRAAE